VVILADPVTTPLVIVVPRDDPQCDELDVLPVLEIKLTELPQGRRACKDKGIVRPGRMLEADTGRNISEKWKHL
jgi:hypothetical protein